MRKRDIGFEVKNEFNEPNILVAASVKLEVLLHLD
jgi:hypothetical protein